MKAVLVLTLSFLALFAFPLAFSKDVEPVLDTNGEPLFSDGIYFILPPIWGPCGGGIELGKTGNSDCPVTVLQSYSEVVPGLPVKFKILKKNPDLIYTDTKLDIEFTKKPNCADTSQWSVFEDDKIQKAYVGIGGPEAHPDQEMLNGRFYIKKYGVRYNTYRLVFCRDGSSTCSDVGRYDNHNEDGRRLVLTDNKPFEVVFINAFKFDGTIKSVV